MNTRIGLIVLSLVYVSLCHLNAAVYYVSSKKGDDKANGRSPTSAWQTLGRACSGLGPSDTLMVFRGSVFREAGVNLGGGTVDAFGPAEIPLPVLSGSIALGGWKVSEHNKKIYQVTCNKEFEHLFVDGVLMSIARYPNSGWARTDNGNSGSQINSSELAKHPRNKPGYWNGANVRWRRWSWWFESRVIQNWDGVKTLQLAGSAIGPNHNGDGSGFYMDNKFEELDYPGEWFLDKQAKILYIYPPDSVEDIGTALIEGMVEEEGMSVSNATVKNLEFRHYKNKALGCGRAAVIDGCVFRGINNVAVTGSWDANGTIVMNSLFEDCLNVGISWNENKANKSKTEFHHNTFNRIGMVEGYGGSGVWHASAFIISNADGVRVHHNRINEVGYCGIILGSPNQIVEYNVFRKCMSTLNDGGAIYTNCDRSVIRHNIILDTIGNNITSQKWANLGQGIWPEFLDDFKESQIINNTVVNSGCHGVFLGNNYACEITGNVLFGNRNGLYLDGRAGKPPQRHNINNNTFVSMGDDQTPILFRSGYDYGSMSGNVFANPYANWIATNGDNWGRAHQPADSWIKGNSWADKNPAMFIGKVQSPGKSPIGRPHCFINDSEESVSLPLKGTWYSIDGKENQDAIQLEPFTSVALLFGKGNPGELKGDYTLASESQSLDAVPPSEQVSARKRTKRVKDDGEDEADVTEAKGGAETAKPVLSEEMISAWDLRLQQVLQQNLSAGKSPYFEFMGKQYRVDELADNGTLKISSGAQKMTYPISRLKLKDKAALSVGMTQKAEDEERALAAFYLYAAEDSKEAQAMLLKVSKEQRDLIKAIFEP